MCLPKRYEINIVSKNKTSLEIVPWVTILSFYWQKSNI